MLAKDVRKDYAAEVRSTLVFKRATGRKKVDIKLQAMSRARPFPRKSAVLLQI
jgi:hypothetical protein